MNQHAIAENSSSSSVGKSLLSGLQKAIECSGRMVMVLQPWYRPKPLTRCWCLYELYLASVSETEVLMTFTPQDEDRVAEASAKNPVLADQMMEHTDVRLAKATKE